MSRIWAFNPYTGGKKIPDGIKIKTKARIEAHASEHFEGLYRRIDVRFRGQFCYSDAFVDHDVSPGMDPAQAERIRNTPMQLCRMRFFGDLLQVQRHEVRGLTESVAKVGAKCTPFQQFAMDAFLHLAVPQARGKKYLEAAIHRGRLRQTIAVGLDARTGARVPGNTSVEVLPACCRHATSRDAVGR